MNVWAPTRSMHSKGRKGSSAVQAVGDPPFSLSPSILSIVACQGRDRHVEGVHPLDVYCRKRRAHLLRSTLPTHRKEASDMRTFVAGNESSDLTSSSDAMDSQLPLRTFTRPMRCTASEGADLAEGKEEMSCLAKRKSTF